MVVNLSEHLFELGTDFNGDLEHEFVLIKLFMLGREELSPLMVYLCTLFSLNLVHECLYQVRQLVHLFHFFVYWLNEEIKASPILAFQFMKLTASLNLSFIEYADAVSQLLSIPHILSDHKHQLLFFQTSNDREQDASGELVNVFSWFVQDYDLRITQSCERQRQQLLGPPVMVVQVLLLPNILVWSTP